MAEDFDEKLAGILQAAAAVFADTSYHAASIRDVSRATGVSLSGLYHYVRGKEELLFLIQERAFAAVLRGLEERLEGVKDPEQRLRALIDNHLRFFVANMKEMKVLSHELDTLRGEYREQVDARKRRYTELCASILRDVAPPGSAIDVRVATFSLFGMMNWIYNWYRPDGDVSVDELAEEMTRLFLRGYRGAELLADRRI